MQRRRKKPRANSEKKRTRNRDGEDQESTAESQLSSAPEEPEPEDEEARLAEQVLRREERRRIREQEPEMFDDYAMSDDSEEPAQPVQDAAGSEKMARDDHVDGTSHELEATGQCDHQDGSDARNEVPNATQPEAEHVSGAREPTMVGETPLPKPRKRKQREDHPPTSPKRQKSKKRQKTAVTPPPPETDRHGNVEQLVPEATVVRKPTKRSQSNMEDYTEPFTKGSDLRHPVYNPESPAGGRPKQAFEVVVPMSTAGPSNSTPDSEPPVPEEHLDVPDPPRPQSNGLRRRKKGPLPSPVKKTRLDQWDVRAQPELTSQNGIARSTAHRTLYDAESVSDSDYENTGKEVQNISPSPSKKRIRSKGKEHARSSKSRTSTPTANGAPRGPHAFRCPICSGTFQSEKSLEKHREDPVAHDHLIECEKCDAQFATKAALARHQKERGHGAGNGQQGRTGRLMAGEVDKIEHWRETFCDQHGINHYEFNDMMTASGKPGNTSWSYKFISKREFLQEYYDVLPGRDTRSMRRYRSNFSNVDRTHDFTEQDDRDILNLVAQYGQKWTEIGDQLTRDPEIVRQRWKNKLRFEGEDTKLKQGYWDEDEHGRFRDAIKDIRDHTISKGDEDIDSFNWSAVSIKVETRNAQQCANHWRALHGKSVKGLWIDSGLSQIMNPKTPSKMEQRLAGKKSKSRIEYSDDDAMENNPIGDSEANSDERRKPAPGLDRTPAVGLSASQAFEQTQANTSTLKKSSKRQKRSTPSQEQPTPGIAVQHRPELSPEFVKKLEEVLDGQDADENGAEDEDDGREAEGAVDQEIGSQEDNQSSPEDDEMREDGHLSDEAQEAAEGETQSTAEGESTNEGGTQDDEVSHPAEDSAPTEVNAEEPAIAVRQNKGLEADRISKIFENAASPNKRTYGRKQRSKRQGAKEYRWPEEDVDHESDGLGVDNLPR